MKKKTFVLIGIIAAVLIGGVLWLAQEQGKVEPQSQMQKDLQSQNQKTDTGMNQEEGRPDNTQEQELVWYEIPELGIRFKVDKVTKEELVYTGIPLTRELKNGESGKSALVYFSTKTLESISKSCSAEEGPAGALSRRVGPPSDSNVPCGGGQKVYEYEGGYFCFTMPQAPCLTREEYEKNQQILHERDITVDFRSEDFWKTVEFTQ